MLGYLLKNFHEDILQEALETNYQKKLKSQDLINQKLKDIILLYYSIN